MHNYKVGDIVTLDYPDYLPEALHYRVGAPIPVNENGQTVAMGTVVATATDNYKLQIYRVCAHQRGPSEIK